MSSICTQQSTTVEKGWKLFLFVICPFLTLQQTGVVAVGFLKGINSECLFRL